jgi:nucleotide-binding universal stress UspA family protein
MSVLVGYVPTPEGEAALQTAIVEARLRETSLVVVNASSGDALADPRHANADVVDRIKTELAGSGVPHTLEIRTGRDPVDEIVTLAEESQAQLVVIGLRPRNPVGKLITGSTAQRILLDAHCPVLAVKAARH